MASVYYAMYLKHCNPGKYKRTSSAIKRQIDRFPNSFIGTVAVTALQATTFIPGAIYHFLIKGDK